MKYYDSPSPQIISGQIEKLDKEETGSQSNEFGSSSAPNDKLDSINEITSMNE